MTKRAWWLVALNLLVPGAAQVVAGNRRLGRFGLATTIAFWALLVIAIVLAVAARGFALALVTNSFVLGSLVALAVFYGVVWLVLTLDTLRLVRFITIAPGARGLVAALAVVSLVVTVGGSGFVAANSLSAIGLLGIFAPGPSQEPIDGRYNILLLGGDAGPDRLGLRPDSISVVSIEAATGAAVIFGIPRNMEHVPFVEGSPLWGPFPTGYDCGVECLVSYLYTYGSEHPELYPDAESAGSNAGIEAMRDAVEGITGLTIPNYVLIDMQGFAQLVDALGGVEVDVPARVPLGINGGQVIGYIEAGVQRMNGDTALWYARSRYETTDYERMERQRQVQEALLRQMDPANVLLSFQGVSAAGQQVVSTDIPQSMLSYFVELGAKTKDLPLTKIDFVPPLIEEEAHPDFALVQATVAAALVPYTPPPTDSAG
jgi:LCP family protein required for cell wall assembly